MELREPVDVAWVAQAFGIYREAVAAGVKPSMHMLNRMLMCLRVAWEGKQVRLLPAALLLRRQLRLLRLRLRLHQAAIRSVWRPCRR